MGVPPSTVGQLISLGAGSICGAEHEWAAPAVSDRCARLAGQVTERGGDLDRPVCYIPPPGASGALAFLAISAVGPAAPVNPRATDAEIARYVERVDPCLLVVGPERLAGLAAIVGVPLAAWEVTDQALSLADTPLAGEVALAGPDDVALVLPTSGTTGLPKQVTLTHAQIMRSAATIAQWLQLGPSDASLTMMPLFHVHGLVAGLLAPLVAGGRVAVEAFDPLRFGSAMERHRPTWFSAVPTMQALLLDRWEHRIDELPTTQLRFLRTSSSALPPVLLDRLESAWGVPVAEAYGMTEASHQIASNPIGPGERRPGSVGLATGTEIRIEDPDADGRGQVLVRGPQVTHGYRRDGRGDAANAESFVDGWFRTGDEGFLDDGWLTLTGRLKEMINRGGEKISPIEVEQVLLSAPGVTACVVFARPHDKLGEEVGAAVVPDGGDFDAALLRTHLRAHLAPFKVPREIVAVDEIPLGPTGKVQRTLIASQLGL